ncbi:MAG TPA: hypothetical protein VFR85_00090 [Anaeromyxobacteraceae bacterium]|nr:hypothetical protein [Anaeromyxobacteraceae bacterium]
MTPINGGEARSSFAPPERVGPTAQCDRDLPFSVLGPGRSILSPVPRNRPRAALSIVAVLALVGASPARRATYRMHGTVQIHGTALDRDMELHADAVVEPGPGPDEVVVHLASMGYPCRVVASRDAAGALAFPPGQTCVVHVRSPDAQGRIEIRLASGRGRLREEDLSLSFRSELSGTVTVGSGRPMAVLGRTVPGTGGSEIPVRGEARATAEGRRDHSRAAER